MDECGRYFWLNGYSWDAVSDELLQEVKVGKEGVSAGGNIYKMIVVPTIKQMPLKTFERLMELAEAGATVAFYGTLPSDVPGLIHLEHDRNKLYSLKDELRFVEKGKVRIAHSSHASAHNRLFQSLDYIMHTIYNPHLELSNPKILYLQDSK